ADRASQDDEPVLHQPVHERRVLIPPVLLPDRAPRIPARPVHQPHREVSHARTIRPPTDNPPTPPPPRPRRSAARLLASSTTAVTAPMISIAVSLMRGVPVPTDPRGPTRRGWRDCWGGTPDGGRDRGQLPPGSRGFLSTVMRGPAAVRPGEAGVTAE